MRAALRAALSALAAVDPARFDGLPAGTTLADVAAALPVDRETVGTGDLGDPAVAFTWVAVTSFAYEGGLRLWVDATAADVAAGAADGAAVLLLEGRDPADARGEPVAAPDLGEPEAYGPAVLGRLRLPDGERVHARRGLAVLVNPGNGVLLGVRGFSPTTAEDYVRRLRPVLQRETYQRSRAGAS